MLIKRQRLAKWIKKVTRYMLFIRNALQVQLHRLKVKGSKKIHHANVNVKKKQVCSNTHTSGEVDFGTKNVARDEGHCVMVKGPFAERHPHQKTASSLRSRELDKSSYSWRSDSDAPQHWQKHRTENPPESEDRNSTIDQHALLQQELRTVPHIPPSKNTR